MVAGRLKYIHKVATGSFYSHGLNAARACPVVRGKALALDSSIGRRKRSSIYKKIPPKLGDFRLVRLRLLSKIFLYVYPTQSREQHDSQRTTPRLLN